MQLRHYIYSPDLGLERLRYRRAPGVETHLRQAGAQCVSSARWDLGGGRPEPLKGKGRPYRDRQVITHHPPRTARTKKSLTLVPPATPSSKGLASAPPVLYEGSVFCV